MFKKLYKRFRELVEMEWSVFAIGDMAKVNHLTKEIDVLEKMLRIKKAEWSKISIFEK
jgi:hypothetical protein